MSGAMLKVRRAMRVPIERPATLRDTESDEPFEIAVENLSETGCLIYSPHRLVPGTEITLGIAGIGRRRAIVRRSEGRLVGCAFVKPLRVDQVDQARLRDNQVSYLRITPREPDAIPATMLDDDDQPALIDEPVGVAEDWRTAAPSGALGLRTGHLMLAAAITCALIVTAALV